LVESRADVSDVLQAALTAIVVDAEQQRAEVRARLARFGPAADDEFLFLMDLDLAPVGRALARLVERRRVLDDQPLPSLLHRFVVRRASVAANLAADPETRRARAREEPLGRGAALDGRPIAPVLRAVLQKVENDEGDAAGTVDGGRIGEMNASLQILKSGRLAVRVERDDFAVEDERVFPLRPPRRERPGHFRK